MYLGQHYPERIVLWVVIEVRLKKIQRLFVPTDEIQNPCLEADRDKRFVSALQ